MKIRSGENPDPFNPQTVRDFASIKYPVSIIQLHYKRDL